MWGGSGTVAGEASATEMVVGCCGCWPLPLRLLGRPRPPPLASWGVTTSTGARCCCGPAGWLEVDWKEPSLPTRGIMAACLFDC